MNDKERQLDRLTLATLVVVFGYYAMRIIVAWLSN